MNRKIFFLIVAFVMICSAIWVGSYLYNKPNQSAVSERSSSTITADSLYHQYEQNEHTADSMYLGKVIEVKGVLAEIDHNGAIDILELSPQKTGGGINCQMFPHDKNSIASYPAIGSSIIIKGKCTGFLMDVSLVDCGVK